MDRMLRKIRFHAGLTMISTRCVTTTQKILSIILLSLCSHLVMAEETTAPEIKQSIDSTVSNKPVYYPQCRQTPLRVGDEDYQDGSN